jgi:hypothetical protein
VITASLTAEIKVCFALPVLSTYLPPMNDCTGIEYRSRVIFGVEKDFVIFSGRIRWRERIKHESDMGQVFQLQLFAQGISDGTEKSARGAQQEWQGRCNDSSWLKKFKIPRDGSLIGSLCRNLNRTWPGCVGGRNAGGSWHHDYRSLKQKSAIGCLTRSKYKKYIPHRSFS